MKWTRSLQMRSVEHDACTQMLVRSPETVHASMYVLPTCPRCIASWLLELHNLGIIFYMCVMHEILNSNTMEETFGEMLRLIFSNPKQQVGIQYGVPTRHEYDTDETMRLKTKYASYLTTMNVGFFTLTDQNGLSILGYSLLTDKTLMIIDFCEYLKDVKAISDFVSAKLNEELAFVITHRVNDESPPNM